MGVGVGVGEGSVSGVGVGVGIGEGSVSGVGIVSEGVCLFESFVESKVAVTS